MLMASSEAVSSPSLSHLSNFSVLQLDGCDVDEGEDSSGFYVESEQLQFSVFFDEKHSSNIGEKTKNYSVTYSIRAPPLA
jgi:hypothetical protein